MDLFASYQQYRINVLGISEHHLPLSDPGFRQKLHETINRCGPSGTIVHQFNSSMETSSQSGRLMGGTGIIGLNESVGKVEPRGKHGDEMGRWSYFHLRRDRRPPVTVISIYQVCKQPTNELGYTAWHQQRRALDLDHRDEHPRHAFQHDLSRFLEQIQSDGHDVIIGGDWNETILDPHSGIAKLCSKHDLIDPWFKTYPGHPEIATFEFGSRRIDAVLVSRRLYPTIRHIGYSPVGLLTSSDHRALIVEFGKKGIFGSCSEVFPSLNARGVRTKDRQSVTTFVEAMHAHLLQNNAFHRSMVLTTSQGFDSELAENLDELVGIAGNIGDKRCRRRRPQWYSIPLVQDRLEISHLKHYYNGLKCQRDRAIITHLNLSLIQRDQTLPSDIDPMRTLLQQKLDNFAKKQEKSEELRRKELSEKATELDGSQQKIQARRMRKISKHEQGLAAWKALSFSKASGNNFQKLDRLEIPLDWTTSQEPNDQSLSDPKTATEWQTITNPVDIEHFLMLRNRMHFGQAQGTPFTVNPLKDHIDWTATSIRAEEVLIGSYVPPDTLTELCTTVLAECKASTSLDSIDATINSTSFANKIRTWRESTTTSPSGRHLGRYKALYAPGIYTSLQPNEVEAFESKQKDIATLIRTIINYCITHGYVLLRWKQIVNTMIFKDAGVFHIHRLRVIHIYEADFNLILAIKWRELLRHADELDIVNESQYGGRQGCEATSLALLEELRTDLSYLTRRTLITFDNDAASCYDRIIPSFASLINRKYGLHKQLAIIHGSTLKEAQYKLRTAIGISDLAYSHCEEFPLYGSGQGSGNSPALWLFISATLFNIHDRLAHGATFQDPSGTLTAHLRLSGFVDDTNATLNDWQPQDEATLDELLKRLCHDAQLWNDLLFISGGKLELSKCSFHVLRFEFSPDGTPRPVVATPPPIQLQDSVTNDPITIIGLGADEPHKTLGHHKSPAGPQRKQLKTLMEKAKQTSIQISTSPVTRYGATRGYNGIYVAGLKYVLPQCHFQTKVLRRAEVKSTPHIIAKCGFLRTTASELIFLPYEYAGGGFVHWDTLQGEGQIKHFLKNWRTNTTISRILRITLAWSQWQAGISSSILASVGIDIPYIECRWIKSLRSFMHHVGATISLDTTFVPTPERIGDRFIMDEAKAMHFFNDKELGIINFCRLYLHVTTTSELYDAAGTKIMPNMYECQRPTWFDPLVVTAIQRQPSHYQRQKTWKKFLSMLPTPRFSRWILGSKLRLRRETYYQPDDNDGKIYHWYMGTYWICDPPIIERGTQYIIRESSNWIPTDSSIPIATTARAGRSLYLDHTTDMNGTTIQANHTPQNHGSFNEYISALPHVWEADLLRHTTWVIQDPYAIINFLHHRMDHQKDELLIVSDGSSFEGHSMSYGVVLGTSKGITLLENIGPAHGIPSSHRAECTGCLAGALLLHHLLQFTNATLPRGLKVRTISDNLSMIRSLTNRTKYSRSFPNATLKTDWDLLEEIHQTYKVSQISLHKYEWIKGHQDANISQHGVRAQLSQEAKYNIRADELAGIYSSQKRSIPHQQVTPLMHHTRCLLQLNNTTHHGHFTSMIRRAASEPDFFTYLTYKHGWNEDTYNEVDWTAFRMAARNFDSSEVHLLKLVHAMLPTRSHLAKFQPWVLPNCHHCLQKDTLEHLQRTNCNSISIDFRNSIREDIDKYFDRHRIPRRFRMVYYGALDEALSPEEDQDDAPRSTVGLPRKDRLDASQHEIGIHLFTRGFLSREWRNLLIDSILTEERDILDLSHKDLGDNVDSEPADSCTIPSISTQSTSSPSQLQPNKLGIDPTTFLAGLIKEMWTNMGLLWTKHQEAIHRKTQCNESPVLRASLQDQVRQLHALKPQARQIHQTTTYFHRNLEEFLDKGSIFSMQSYVDRYQPVILASVRQATQPTTSDTTDVPPPSHVSHTRRLATPRRISQLERRNNIHVQAGNNNTTSRTTANRPSIALRHETTTTGHHALEEAPHRKRNRRKKEKDVINLITNYFRPLGP